MEGVTIIQNGKKEEFDRLKELVTEGRSVYHNLDELSIREVLTIINQEDTRVPLAVAAEIPRIEEAVRLIVDAFRRGGRLFYIGAGTSGRLGVLDASECPPTFGVPADMVQGIIAGGDIALRHPIEGAEDDPEAGARDTVEREVGSRDVVVGIAASGRTPYVLGAVEEARHRGAATVALVCNPDSPLARTCQVAIAPVVGSEVLMGSTRMKAGTAQKLVLNMLTTTAMVKIGKVYSNLMVDVQATNEKLNHRAVRIVQLATGCSADVAASAFARSGGHAKTAIVMLLACVDPNEAKRLLDQANGFVKEALRLAAVNKPAEGKGEGTPPQN